MKKSKFSEEQIAYAAPYEVGLEIGGMQAIQDPEGIGERMVIENSGTIRADIAIYSPSDPPETFTTSTLSIG